jgi:calcineurin-like phosphoesterase family protein
MLWLFFVKIIRQDVLNVVLTNMNLQKLEIKRFEYNLDNIESVEFDILQCFNNIIAVKDKIYIVCEKDNDKNEYDFIKTYMRRLNSRIIDIIDYDSFKILMGSKDANIIRLIEDNLKDKFVIKTIKS